MTGVQTCALPIYYGAEPDELFALGDRYQVDVAPLVELGGAGVQISSVADAENIIKTKLM